MNSYITNTPPPAPVQDPSLPPRPEAGRGKAAAITVGVLAAIFAALCILFGTGVSHLRAASESPVWRSLRAVMPGAEVVESFLYTGGAVTAEGYCGSAVIPTMPDARDLGFCVELDMDPLGRMEMFAELYSGEESIGDLSLFLGDKGVSLQSQTLLDGRLTIPFAGVAIRLEQSVLAPDSGSDYALDEATYASLMDMARFYDTALATLPGAAEDPDAVTTADVQALLSDILTRLQAVVEGLTRTEERREVELLDRTVKAKVYTYTADEAYVLAILDFLREEWVSNPELERILRALLRNTVPADADREAAVDAAYEALSEQFIAVVDGEAETLRDATLELTLEVAVKSNYLVAADLAVSFVPAAGADTADASDAPADAAERRTTVSLRLTSAPDDDPSVSFELESAVADAPALRITFSRTDVEETARSLSTWEGAVVTLEDGRPCTEDRVLFVFEHRPSAAYSASLTVTTARAPYGKELSPEHREETLAITAEGALFLSKNQLEWELTHLTVTDPAVNDGKTATYTEEDLYLYLSVLATHLDAPALPTDGDDPLTFTDEEMEAFIRDLEGRFTTFRQDFNDALGQQVFKPHYNITVSSTLTVTDGMTHYTVDAATGHVIVVTTTEEGSYLHIYEPVEASMKHLAATRLDRPVAAIDADGGRIALSYVLTETKRDGTVHLFDAEDGHPLAAYDVVPALSEDFIDCIGIDGAYLFCTTEDPHTTVYMVDIETGATVRTLGEQWLHHPAFAIDRDRNHLLLVEHDLVYSFCYLYDTVTGELLATYELPITVTGLPYMTGSHILVEDRYLDLNGEQADPFAAVADTLYGSPAFVLRMDDLVHAYLTRAEDGYLTELFTPDGAPIAYIYELTTDFIPCGENTYLIYTYNGKEYRLSVLKFVEDWSMDRSTGPAA